ncbi:10884_t:CDS:2 [Paraglomus brasilianum]|uniref:10884_t:CDS:1 n=1 Tax=Paraglomus brasilianum TaxID=144538 RepID=A0A9N9FZT9_9GLOM|nr:10884_t:CDS:2 [Paraglomus brasilianum]
MQKSFFGNYALDEAIAGFVAGATSTICLHPLEIVKIRFQIDDTAKFRRHWLSIGGTAKALRAIARYEGLLGLYRGLSPNFAGSAASWGFYFYLYSLIKLRMAGEDKTQKLSPAQYLLASAGAGAVVALCTNPLWVVKVRMCASRRGQPDAYSGLFDGLYQIVRYEGIRGLYKGLVPALFSASHGALQFMAYEELKKWRSRINPDKDRNRLSNIEYILLASSSKTFASTITHPFQLIKARLMNQRLEKKYYGVIDTIRKTYRLEGLFGFYKGIAPAVIRVLPGTCVTFVVYENLSAYFREHAQKST